MIGRRFVFDGRAYRLKLDAAETKSGCPYVAAAPHELAPYMDLWLEVYGVQLIARAEDQVDPGGNHLWIDRWGKPMSSKALRRQIWWRTRQAFGKGICPHLFRDCAVTELVDSAPEEIGIAPDLLGHADLRTTRKHYIQAQGMTAHARIQDMIAARRQAAARGTSGD
jgi:integrase/recombinase XerC